MIYLEKMARRQVTSANYLTAVNERKHPDRIMKEHDFLYLLDGEWEICENGVRYQLQTDDLLILTAGRHHWGEKLCRPGCRHMYFHVLPTQSEMQMEQERAALEAAWREQQLLETERRMTLRTVKQEWKAMGKGEKVALRTEKRERTYSEMTEQEWFAPEKTGQANAISVTEDWEYSASDAAGQQWQCTDLAAAGPKERDMTDMDKMEESGMQDVAKRLPEIIPCASLLHCQREPRIRKYFQELITAYWSQDEERENRLSLFFNLILCELFTLQSGTAKNAVPDPMIEQVRQKLYSNPQIFYSSKEMAEQFYICARTLNNRFQRACGVTFSSYQMEIKLEMVREFLCLQPDATLHDAAVNFGFYDEFHLSKAFRKKYGQPPSKLRKEASVYRRK